MWKLSSCFTLKTIISNWRRSISFEMTPSRALSENKSDWLSRLQQTSGWKLQRSLTGALRAPAITPTPGPESPETTCCPISELCASQTSTAESRLLPLCGGPEEPQRTSLHFAPPPPLSLSPLFCSPDNILSPGLQSLRREYFSKCTGPEITLREHFASSSAYENLNSFPLNGKQRSKQAQ